MLPPSPRTILCNTMGSSVLMQWGLVGHGGQALTHFSLAKQSHAQSPFQHNRGRPGADSPTQAETPPPALTHAAYRCAPGTGVPALPPPPSPPPPHLVSSST